MIVAMSRRLACHLPLFLLLCACAPRVPYEPPEEVLRKAFTVAQGLKSAAYQADVDLEIVDGPFGKGEITARIEGLLNDSGNLVSGHMDGTGSFSESDDMRSIHAVVDFVISGADQFFLYVQDLRSDPPLGFLNPSVVSGVLGHWWEIVKPSTAPAVAVTPSPQLLHMQLAAVKVTEDLGVETAEGVPVRRYVVSIDHDRFVAYAVELGKQRGTTVDEQALRRSLEQLPMTGELTIGALDHTLRTMQWDIAEVSLQDGTKAHITFSLALSKVNTAGTIAMPTDVKPFPLLDFFAQGEESLDLPPGVDPALLQSVIGESSADLAFPPLQ